LPLGPDDLDPPDRLTEAFGLLAREPLAPAGRGKGDYYYKIFDDLLRSPTPDRTPSFPRSAWECRLRRSASGDRRDALPGTQSVPDGILTRSVGTRETFYSHHRTSSFRVGKARGAPLSGVGEGSRRSSASSSW